MFDLYNKNKYYQTYYISIGFDSTFIMLNEIIDIETSSLPSSKVVDITSWQMMI